MALQFELIFHQICAIRCDCDASRHGDEVPVARSAFLAEVNGAAHWLNFTVIRKPHTPPSDKSLLLTVCSRTIAKFAIGQDDGNENENFPH